MKIDRLISMIMKLLEKNRISAKELANIFEVSERTIYRDIESINMAGIPIYSIPGVNGGFEILEQYKIDKNVFSNTNLSLMLMGLRNLSKLIQDDSLVHTIAKINHLIPPDQSKEVELKSNQIHIDLSPWIGNKNIQTNIDIVKKALSEHRVLSFEYTDRYGSITKRTAEPYQLVLKSNQWYWYGYCLERRDYRLFRMSRVLIIHLEDNEFKPRDYHKPMLDFMSILPTIQLTIQIRIYHTLVERVLEYCTFDHFTKDGDEHYIVQFPFIENDFYYNILIGFGYQCECIGPSHIRNEIKHRIDMISKLYED